MKPDFSTRRVVVFDMDDTLFPESDYVRSGFMAVDRHLVSTTGVRGFFENAWRRFGTGERGAIFDVTLPGLGLPSDKDFVKALVAVYRSHRPDIRTDEWVSPLFSRLHAGGRRIGVITDGPLVMQEAKVVALGLRESTEAVVLSDALGGESMRKPAAAPYLKLAETLGARPEECVYIGDNPAKDFLGARRVGWASIRLRIPGRLHAKIEPAEGAEADVEVGGGPALAALLFR